MADMISPAAEAITGQDPGITPEAPSEVIPQVYKIDDKEHTIDEIKTWRDGHLRQEDYTKKTMSLAEERKRWETEERDRFSQERDNFVRAQQENMKRLQAADELFQLYPQEISALQQRFYTQGGQQQYQIFNQLQAELGVIKQSLAQNEAEKIINTARTHAESLGIKDFNAQKIAKQLTDHWKDPKLAVEIGYRDEIFAKEREKAVAEHVKKQKGSLPTGTGPTFKTSTHMPESLDERIKLATVELKQLERGD